MSNSKLSSKKVLNTVGLLKTRIEERFPGSGLGKVCSDLQKIARRTDETIEDIQQNRTGYRMLVFSLLLVVLVLSAIGLSQFRAAQGDITILMLLELLDSVFNIVLLSGGAVIFLISYENRTKRSKVVKAVNELRCLAHVIDSHQLTKDPCYLDQKKVIRTTHSPERNMTAFELSRYLDYCSEMLSLVSKVAFLYVQDFHDPVATNSVKDLEDLTNGLSRKIWQKIINIRQEPIKEAPEKNKIKTVTPFAIRSPK